ncbi:MAG: hypothetical protein AB7O59_13460 [Pirellulales bacterium]
MAEDLPFALTCPQCGGTLCEMSGGQLVQFRCPVGHSYTGESLLARQGQELELALWSDVRALDENAVLARRMAVHAQHEHRAEQETANRKRAQTAQQQADTIRTMLVAQPPAPMDFERRPETASSPAEPLRAHFIRRGSKAK